MAEHVRISIPERVGARAETDYSTPVSDFGPLARDRIPIRSLRDGDLAALTAIDGRVSGRSRAEYLQRKMFEVLHESVRVSLVAELDGVVVGFIMARVDLGEFGRLEPAAVLDTLAVDPDYRGRGVGRALLTQLLANLTALRVERILTEVEWTERDLLSFLGRCGFKPSSRLCFRQRPK